MNTKQSNFLELQIGDNSTYFDVTSGYPIKNRKISIDNIIKSTRELPSNYQAASTQLIQDERDLSEISYVHKDGSNSNIENLHFKTDVSYPTSIVGDIGWNEVEGTYDVRLLNNTILQLGQEFFIYAKALEAINNGDVVQYVGAQGNHITIKRAVPSEVALKPALILGIATENISQNYFGYVTALGKVNDVRTLGFNTGDVIYFGNTVGSFTNVAPTSGVKILLGSVLKASTGNAENGSLSIRVIHKPKIEELSSVKISNIQNKDLLTYINGEWVNSKDLEVNTITSNNGFIKKNSSDGFVLLGGGGHKPLSDFGSSGGGIQFETDPIYIADKPYIALKSEILTKTSQLLNDSGYVIDSGYVHTDNNYTTTEKSKLSGIQAGAEVNVNADWNAVSGDARILNKPTIPTKLSDLQNDSSFITTETDPIFTSSPAHNITNEDIVKLSNLSGTNSGDQDLSGLATKTYVDTTFSPLGHNHNGIYQPVMGENDNYVTDGEKTKLSNLSGVNTGDQDLSDYVKGPDSSVDGNIPLFDNTTGKLIKDSGVKLSDLGGGNITETDPIFVASPAHNITSEHITLLGNTSGINTGDQDLTPYLTKVEATNTYQPLMGSDDNYVTDDEKTKLANLSGINSGDETVNSLKSKLDTVYEPIRDANEKYVTDAQLVVINNTSGTNSGDETVSTLKSKLDTVYAPINHTHPEYLTEIADNSITYNKVGTALKSKNSVTSTIDLSASGIGEITLSANTAFTFTGFQLNKNYILKIVSNGFTPSWSTASKHINIKGNAEFTKSGTFYVTLTCVNATSGSEKLLTVIMEVE